MFGRRNPDQLPTSVPPAAPAEAEAENDIDLPGDLGHPREVFGYAPAGRPQRERWQQKLCRERVRLALLVGVAE